MYTLKSASAFGLLWKAHTDVPLLFLSGLHVSVYVSPYRALLWASMSDIFPLDFLKVVSTTYNLLSGETVNSHQYSVTQFERDLTQGNAPGKEGHGRGSFSQSSDV